jgi:threonine/homoserine/homoserine lactone efflux protein
VGQTLILSMIYVIIATCIHSSIVGIAGAARPFLDDPVRTRIMRRSLASGLACIALWFAYSTAQ